MPTKDVIPHGIVSSQLLLSWLSPTNGQPSEIPWLVAALLLGTSARANFQRLCEIFSASVALGFPAAGLDEAAGLRGGGVVARDPTLIGGEP